MIGKNQIDNLSEIKVDAINKPIIIYAFINPLSHTCWSLEPLIKKMVLEYGDYFTVRPVISFGASSNEKKIKTSVSFLKQNLGLAIKAAGLQGNKVGRQFLQKIQEAYFFYDDDLLDENVMMTYASLLDLDLNEFSNDLYSHSAKKAYQADLKLKKEMNIKELPSLVFFSKHNEMHNLKITGLANYNDYIYLLYKLLNKKITPKKKPHLKSFLMEQSLLSLEDIAFIYDWTRDQTKVKLNELKLTGDVEELTILSRKYWTYKHKK
ncbi:MAG TPA: DsbA family protein [Pseudogracilibacillus sp.]|nr:DsbA family protein [Pseudogracilibacillus sp.]